jgi:superfamily II DNA or RNA helicase
MQELPEGVVPGAIVEARGERWRVRHARQAETAALVTLEGLEPTLARRVSTLLTPIDRIRPVLDRAPIGRGRQRVVRGMLHAAGRVRPARGLWCAAAARMDIWPWQLAPALAVLREGATRLLLADAVGLGKTVQAGLVLAELRARGLVERAVVLAPAAVRDQWADELRSRFALPAHVLDLRALLELAQEGPAMINPWARAPLVVSSIDLVKRAEIRAAVEHAPFDLLIVDEAHHATPGTDRHEVVSRLARHATWVLLVSATPHSGKPAAWQALLALGDTTPGTPMRVFRRTQADVSALVRRRTHVWRVQPSAGEALLHAGVLGYARQLCRLSPGTTGVQLLAALLARRATSSARAARLTLERRLAWLSGAVAAPSEQLQPLPWEEFDLGDGDSACVAGAGFADRQSEQQAVRALIERARAAEHASSKLSRLQRFVRRIHEPVIVFSEFRDTLEACREALEAITSVAVLHGALDAAERRRQLTKFSDGQARVLLTTDVAGEGLNLHHAARLVVTIEWPWSPLRLEQRIGRVHRLGQSRPVHAVHMTAAASYEELVVAHVRERASRAEDALRPSGAQVEETLTALVLDLPLTAVGAEQVSTSRAEVRRGAEDAIVEADRVKQARTLAGTGAARLVDAVWSLPPRRKWSQRAVVLIEVMHHRAAGGPRSTSLVPIEVALHAAIRGGRSWRACAADLARDPRVHRAAVAAAAHEATADQWQAATERLERLWLASRLIPAVREVQPSLFDRRAIRTAAHQQRAETSRTAWHDGMRKRLAEAPLRVTTRALAVLPLGGQAE